MGSVESTEQASQQAPPQANAPANAQGASDAPKKSFYKRYRESKASKSGAISDEDMLKYTGKTKAEINEWSKMAPGVAGNQSAGSITAGSSGLGGMAAGDGYGGWGWDANSPVKYPPQQQAPAADKKSEEEQK